MENRFRFRQPHKCVGCGFFAYLLFNCIGGVDSQIKWDREVCHCGFLKGAGHGMEPCGDPQQCTGLKDRNDKLIYEGDILSVGKPHIVEIGNPLSERGLRVVKWDDDRTGFSFRICGPALVEHNASTVFQVLGNIHQDSHLLDNPEAEKDDG